MQEGYYFYSERYGTGWHPKGICFVSSGHVHFFGQVPQKIGNEYLKEYVLIGERVVLPGGEQENKILPITPDKVSTPAVPDKVIAIFNQLIDQNWNGRDSKVMKKDVVNTIKRSLGEFNVSWLDVEPIYIKAGWKVSYEAPEPRGSHFDAFYLFEKPT